MKLKDVLILNTLTVTPFKWNLAHLLKYNAPLVTPQGLRLFQWQSEILNIVLKPMFLTLQISNPPT